VPPPPSEPTGTEAAADAIGSAGPIRLHLREGARGKPAAAGGRSEEVSAPCAKAAEAEGTGPAADELDMMSAADIQRLVEPPRFHPPINVEGGLKQTDSGHPDSGILPRRSSRRNWMKASHTVSAVKRTRHWVSHMKNNQMYGPVAASRLRQKSWLG
jgi:hypothetical protein